MYKYTRIKDMEEKKRLINLIGESNLNKLKDKKVAIFGIGGVGGYVCEALARCFVGEFLLVDFDTVALSNINRQIIAMQSTVNQKKVDVMEKRILDINPSAKIQKLDICINKDNISSIDFSRYDFVVDAIDMVSSKLLIIEKAKQNNIQIISCMGTGNKLDATKLQIQDISKTNYCPLAKVMRKELKNRNITNIPVLFSTEQPQTSNNLDKTTPASIVYVPATAGLLIAQYVITKFMEK